jgi:enamine deaminase RidA (YjgF/YER057c/UK114 family)
MAKIENRIKKLGLVLPPAPEPMGSYVPWTRRKKLLFISGQLPRKDGKVIYQGRVPAEISLDQAKEGARLAGLNAISVIKAAAKDLDKVAQILRITCWVASSPDFFDQPKVANGASDLMVEVFGEAGKHSRMTTGVIALPGNACFGVDLVVELK